MLYWEDLIQSAPRHFGPVTIPTAALDDFLDLVGERHPIHDDDAFAGSVSRKARIVPGGLIHSTTSGWLVRNGSTAAVIGLRSMQWQFVRPIYPDVEFYFTSEVTSSRSLNAVSGLIWTERRITGSDASLLAIGRLETVVQKKPG